MQTNSKPAVERSTDGKTPDAGMRPGASAKTVDNERRILRAAEEEFLCKGFDGARTTAIAERAGVTHAMLHYYFRTKEKLFDKILEDKVSELRRVLFGFLDNEELPFCERIEQGMRNHFAFLTKNPHLPLFIINELHRENNSVQKQRQANRAVIEEFQATLQSAIDRAAAAGQCRPIDAGMLTLDILSLNMSPFVAAPVILTLFGPFSDDREAFLKARLEENITTILNRLKP